jgi:hypothetical protein
MFFAQYTYKSGYFSPQWWKDFSGDETSFIAFCFSIFHAYVPHTSPIDFSLQNYSTHIAKEKAFENVIELTYLGNTLEH